jgi:hypothetical protein
VNPSGIVVRPNPEFAADQTFTVPPFIAVDEATDRIAMRQPRFQSHGNHILRQRAKPRIVSMPSFSSLGECELLYAQLLLHVPHRGERFDLLGGDYEFTDAHVMDAWERHTGGGDLERNAPPAIAARSARIGQSVFNNFRLVMGGADGRTQLVPGSDAAPHSSSFGRGCRVETPNTSISSGEQSSQIQTNSRRGEGQARALRVVATHLAGCRDAHREGTIQPEPPHIFITGGAGAGKSYVIAQIAALFRNDDARNPVHRAHGGIVLMATTGVAANNIGGCTYHRGLGLRPMRKGTVTRSQCSSERLQTLRRNWDGVRCVVLDECSMCSAASLAQISNRLNLIMGLQDDPLVTFGNLFVILVGDFYQLRPVSARFMFQDQQCGEHDVNLYRSLFHPILLEGSFRQ